MACVGLLTVSMDIPSSEVQKTPAELRTSVKMFFVFLLRRKSNVVDMPDTFSQIQFVPSTLHRALALSFSRDDE